MRIEEALAGYLRADVGLAALVGTRIYPAKSPQSAPLPCIVYDLLGGEVVTAHDGFTGLRTGRISFSCCAGSYASAKGVAEAVRYALAGFRGTLGDLTVSIPQTYEDEDLYDDTLSLYIVVVDFEMHWSG